MRVLAFDPFLAAARARALQVELCDELNELLPHCDFLTLHTPLTAETHHLLSAARLTKCKRGAGLINCARGGLIDEAALVDSLGNGQIAGAALDVFETEPLPNDSPLRGIPNLILTPHLGASTAEAQERVGIKIAQAIRAALLEGTIRDAVNPAKSRRQNARDRRAASAFWRKARPLPRAARAAACRELAHQLQRQSQRSGHDCDHARDPERFFAPPAMRSTK